MSVLPVKAWQRPLLGAIAAGALFFVPSGAEAATFNVGGLRFSESAGDFRLTNGFVSNGRAVLLQEVFGPNVDLSVAVRGLADLGILGFRIDSIVTNSTGTPWQFYDFELQQSFGTPSPEADGLSFAQGRANLRPFTSSRFSSVDEVTDVRDFINFSGGIVNPGETVRFSYVITDTTPTDLFFIRQRPNFVPGGTGFVQVPPPAPEPPVTPLPVTPPSPPTPPVPTPIEVPEDTENPVAVPEPTGALVLLMSSILSILSLRRTPSSNI
ncbi:MAG: hypothetical protein F6K04_14835 [Leptolyngbya sp. SIO4C5]|uniref:hypothetical protein n=1 Tax=Sphaerothrix gracilis TaxID=3151835 RepID=UPI0013C1D695|nr:hypothetical protein [Leptolyngbya sp. SIO4C5]